MSCALGEWQHTRPTTLHQVIDLSGDVHDTFRNKATADRVADSLGYKVKTVHLSEYLKENTHV